MIIIPARLQSTRFPKKILVDIGGLPMVVRVARLAQSIDRAVVATDSLEVVDICKQYDIESVMTKDTHQSGTDRINEAAEILEAKEDEIIINLQGDEPFLESGIIERLKKRVEKTVERGENVTICSCYKRVDKEKAQDPNLVKVVIDSNEYAIYFSRSAIPYDRDRHDIDYFAHLGIYGFTRASLREFCALPQSYLENIEKLEQLRAISYGKKIAMIEVESESFGIDTKEDLERAVEKFLG